MPEKNPTVINLSEEESDDVEVKSVENKPSKKTNLISKPERSDLKRKRPSITNPTPNPKTRSNKNTKGDISIEKKKEQDNREDKSPERPVLRKKIKISENKSKIIVKGEKNSKIKPTNIKKTFTPITRKDKEISKEKNVDKTKEKTSNMTIVEEIELHLKQMNLDPIENKKGTLFKKTHSLIT